jgi:NADPH:quinone reductase-like Zn-dependent oxidoreductase
MLASGFTDFGGPEVLRVVTLPEPVAGPGEVVVRVAAATVNPTDTLMRAGRQTALMAGLSPPFVAGMEFAGHIHALGGPCGTLRVGQPVMGLLNPRRPGGGAHAQYVRVPAASLALLPPALDLVEAATVPMNGLTAWMALEALELCPGGMVLVTGAAGAVGGYVIQLARHAGLTVIADAREEDADLVRRLGAHHVVPRGEGMDAAVRRRCPAGVDGLVDGALLGERAGALVRSAGVAVSLRRSNAIADSRLRQHGVSVTERLCDTAALAALAGLVRKGVLVPRVARTLPLSRAAEAHRLVEQGGLRGRVVLTP